MTTVTVRGVDLVVDDLPGEAAPAPRPPVVVLHGFTGSARAMAPLVDRLAGRRLVPDLVGHGRSDAPADVESYSMAAMIEQVRAIIAGLSEPPVDIVGYSMGARTALSIAGAEPALVRTLCLIGGTAGIADPVDRAERAAADRALADAIESDGVRPFVDRWEALPLFATQRALPPAQREALRAERLAQRPHGLANHLRAAGTGAMPSLWDRLGEIRVPTALVVGELDAKFEAIAQHMAEAMPCARVRVVAGAGHAAHIERPDAVAGVVEALRADHG